MQSNGSFSRSRLAAAAVMTALACGPAGGAPPGPDRPTIAELTTDLGKGDAAARGLALRRLAAAGPIDEAVAAIVPALTDADPHLVRAAATAIGAIGPVDGAERTDDVIDALRRCAAAAKDAETCAACIVAIGDYGPAAESAVGPLTVLLRDKAALVREAAAAALAAIGPEARAATGVLATLLRGDEPLVRAAAAAALAGIGPDARDAVMALSDAVADANPLVRGTVVRAIAAIGPDAAAATGPLVRALGDIGAIDAPEPLGRALDDDDADVRYAAAYSIADIPQVAASLETALVAAADDEDVRVRMEVAPSLARIGTAAAKKALDALVHDEDANVADVARNATAQPTRGAK